MDRTYNINDDVCVALTEDGKQHIINWYAKYNLGIDVSTHPVLIMPLWELMRIFGDQMYMSNNKQMFVDSKITIKKNS